MSFSRTRSSPKRLVFPIGFSVDDGVIAVNGNQVRPNGVGCTRLWRKLFGARGVLAEARRSEARGELARATELYVEANAPLEACRLVMLRAEAEVDPRARLALYVQAAFIAPDGSS